uniref:CCHC-type domain-containing protein n=1 Tax=Cannabis sativa TaxID=3483 RepID=A0A803PJ02_CANSA
MKLCKENGEWIWANFKYEHLPTFCFICGIIGHSERFCPKRFDQDFDQLGKPYGLRMKAQMRRKNYLIGAQWLKTGNEDSTSAIGGSVRRSEAQNSADTATKIMEIDSMISCHRDKCCDSNAKERGSGKPGENIDSNIVEDIVNLSEKDMTIMLENKKRRMDMASLSGHVATGNMDKQMMEKESNVGSEPKNMLKDTVEKLRVSLGFDGAFSADVQGRSGGVAMLWRHEEEVQLLGYGPNYIDVSIDARESGRWRLTGLYGEPNRTYRKKTWDLIRGLKDKYDLPWCIVGDLNNVTSQQDKRGGNPYLNWLIEGFWGVLDECGLHDLDLSGYPYTWERGRGTDEWIEVRIDRALVSQRWLSMFPTVKLYNLEVSTLDHCPLHLMPANLSYTVATSKVFRFENCWLKEPLCYKVVEDTWNQYKGSTIMEKIKGCGRFLLNGAKTTWGILKKESRSAKLKFDIGKRGEIRWP